MNLFFICFATGILHAYEKSTHKCYEIRNVSFTKYLLYRRRCCIFHALSPFSCLCVCVGRSLVHKCLKGNKFCWGTLELFHACCLLLRCRQVIKCGRKKKKLKIFSDPYIHVNMNISHTQHTLR